MEEPLNGVVTDSNGSIFAAGPRWRSNGVLVLRADSSGSVTWARALEAPWTLRSLRAVDLALDVSSAVIVVGSDRHSTLLARLTLDGEIEYLRELAPPTGFSDEAASVAVDATGTIYIGGAVLDWQEGKYHGLLLQLDENGTLIRRRLVSESGASVFGMDVAVDPEGNGYLVGRANFDHFFVARFLTDLQLLWTDFAIENYDYSETGRVGVAIDDDGSAVLTGTSIWKAFVARVLPNRLMLFKRLIPVSPVDYGAATTATNVAVDSGGLIVTVGAAVQSSEQNVFVTRGLGIGIIGSANGLVDTLCAR